MKNVSEGQASNSKLSRHDFALEAFVDFPDDAICAPEPITPAHIDAMMQRLVECGVRRVSWEVYGDGRGGLLMPDHDPKWKNMAQTYHLLGQNSISIAVEAAHRHGLEIYGYFKPYETGCSMMFPEGSYEGMVYGRLSQIGGRMTWIDPFVVDHPQLRIKRRTDGLPADIQNIPICGLKLRKLDAAPTRITREHLQIWVSDLNFQYRHLDIPFTITESIEPCPRDIQELKAAAGQFLARKGDPQRVLTLGGFSLKDRYVLVTTDFAEGTADFANTDMELLSALDAQGHEIPGVTACGTAIWLSEKIDFRKWGLMFDHGYGGQLMRLDEPNGDGRKGIVAFARGRNEYLPGALCETEPEVQAYWLSRVEDILDSGVDGIDFREENHSSMTNFAEEYGFNDVVLEKCRQRGQVDLATIAQVRGDAYTDFLAKAKKAINARGKKMRLHFQIDWYRPDPPRHRRPAYPANLDFQWREWIERGLTDEAVLRFFALPFDCIFNDTVAHELSERCRAKGIPLTFNKYIYEHETLADEIRRVHQDGRFAGFIIYETSWFLKIKPGGECALVLPDLYKGLQNVLR